MILILLIKATFYISTNIWWIEHGIKLFGLIKKMFIGLLGSIVNASNYTKCFSLNNQKCMIEPTLINLHPNEYNQEFLYYASAIKSDRCLGKCNALNDLSNKVCFVNKTEDSNVSVFNMTTGISESKTLQYR